MKVKLIASTPNALDIAYTACKTCYSEQEPSSLFIQSSLTLFKHKVALINKVWNSGHLSTAEHICFTFAIEGVSRACSHQLVRHRFCSFSQQSQRYVDMGNPEFIIPKLPENGSQEILGRTLNNIRDTYNFMVASDIKKEDARCVLPNATSTNLVMTCNLRELMHICNLRLCTRAQKEIRELFKAIAYEVIKQNGWLKDYLVPQCEKDGFCREHNCCGRKQQINEILRSKNEIKD